MPRGLPGGEGGMGGFGIDRYIILMVIHNVCLGPFFCNIDLSFMKFQFHTISLHAAQDLFF